MSQEHKLDHATKSLEERAQHETPDEVKARRRSAGKVMSASFVAANLLFVALIVAILIPGEVTVRTSVPFIVASCIVEALFLWRYFAGGRKPSTWSC